MPRASFTGTLTVLEVGIPIKAYSVVKTADEVIEFKVLHKECMTPVNQMYACPQCAITVAKDEQVKGFHENSQWFLATEDELNSLKPEAEEGRPIVVEQIIRPQEIDPRWIDRKYYLTTPDQDVHAAHSYAVFSRALREERSAAVVTYVSHGHTHLGVVSPSDDSLMLSTLHYMDRMQQLADLDFEITETKLRAAEVKMARQVVDTLKAPFAYASFKDQWAERAGQFRAAKLAQKPFEVKGHLDIAPLAAGPLEHQLKRSLVMLREQKKTQKRRKAS